MKCPRVGCERVIMLDRFACRDHWRALPHRVKQAVWRRWQGVANTNIEDLWDDANAAWDEAGVK